ncbi:hypothetical protein LPJ59_002657 [Coemansia sp. RSA 2399]|nr:hypothetical protein LPJ59_002657 [Coemansia sp. RSA 2399]KAJ1904757.1 hypothetical protein LPJ81_002308 [Coemansia sp. IMI 209127]KAJ2859213.1 hypothetical protein GGI22_003062 [Coemansia erecta]
MNHFYYDFSKAGAFDITNGDDTVTINSVKHVVDVCVCDNCKKIVAAKKAAQKEEWTYKYVYTPPAPAAPAPKCCCHGHHHH